MTEWNGCQELGFPVGAAVELLRQQERGQGYRRVSGKYTRCTDTPKSSEACLNVLPAKSCRWLYLARSALMALPSAELPAATRRSAMSLTWSTICCVMTMSEPSPTASDWKPGRKFCSVR